MLKKIFYSIVLILLSLFSIAGVRNNICDNFIYPTLFNIAKENDNFLLYLKCGQLKLMTQDYDTAEKMFRTIISKAHGEDNKRVRMLAYYNLGNVFYITGEYNIASKAYAIVLKDNPTNKSALKKLSRIKMSQGQYATLYPYVNAYIKKRPADAFGYSEQCAILARVEKLHEAKVACENAIKFDKNYARAHYDYADVFQKLGFRDLAEKEYEIAKNQQSRIKSREELERMLYSSNN